MQRSKLHDKIGHYSVNNKIGPGDITVAISGSIIAVHVSAGDEVKAGQVVLVIEAMRMETEIKAPVNGVVAEVLCQKGDKVTPGQILIRMEVS
ncbi:biotin/lipoyl-binding protein [Legionella sp. PATHC032]|uniref:biotin/lipoyl-containing protein n=1 Tax=Legionella sp. PATHC032 TaxID=2992039 RepID=UPI00224311BF|nr:biotin/lipoyl-containing protein [Legionella sp. PATHC032]MCW8420477.1 biotin/lipoyl-binding protein [Legionella sp. PATHC032]